MPYEGMFAFLVGRPVWITSIGMRSWSLCWKYSNSLESDIIRNGSILVLGSFRGKWCILSIIDWHDSAYYAWEKNLANLQR